MSNVGPYRLKVRASDLAEADSCTCVSVTRVETKRAAHRFRQSGMRSPGVGIPGRMVTGAHDCAPGVILGSWSHDEALAESRPSMIRIMTRRVKATTVAA